MIKTEIIFKLLKMTKKMEILDNLKSFFQKINSNDKNDLAKTQEETGIDFAMEIIGNADKAEPEFYEVIASITEKNKDEIKDIPLDESIDALKELYASGAFKSFLKLVSK